jgi:putative inorganic carbon (hco3(-)) transporter
VGSLDDTERLRATACMVATVTVLGGISLMTAAPVLVGAGVAICIGMTAISPLGGLSAIMVTLPWFYRPIGIGANEVAISELLLLSTGVGSALHLSAQWVRSRTPLRDIVSSVVAISRSRLILLLGLLAIVGLVLSLAPYNPDHRPESLREWRWVLAEPLVLLVLLAVFAIGTAARRVLAIALIIGVMIAAMYGFADLVGRGGVEAEGVTRISGPFPHPNALALMTTRAAVLAIAWMTFDRSIRRALAVPVLISVLAVLATFSRGAWASLTTAVLLSATFLGHRMRQVVIVTPIVLLAGAVALASDRMLSLFGGGSGSLRVSIWSSALEMIRDRPILGYGPDQFLYAYLPRYVEPAAWQERFSAHAHNLILDFWIRLGIIGGAFAISVVIVCLVAVAGIVRRSRGSDALSAAAVTAIAAVIVHGFVDDAYFSHELAMSGWFLAWLAFQPGPNRAVDGAQNSASPRLWRRGFHRITPVRQLARRWPRSDGG